MARPTFAKMQRGRVWWNHLQPPLEAVFLSKVQLYWWAWVQAGRNLGCVWKMVSVTPSSPLQVGDLRATTVQETVTEIISPPVSRPSTGHHAQPVCARAIVMPGATVLLCFILGTRLEFKTPNLKGPSKARTHSPLGERRAKPSTFCPRKAVAWTWQRLESMVKHSEESPPGYLPSAGTSVPCC